MIKKYGLILFKNMVGFFSLILIFLSIYIKINFGNASFEQLFFSFLNSSGTSVSAIKDGFIFVFLFSFSTFFLGKFLFDLVEKSSYRFCCLFKKLNVWFLVAFSFLFSLFCLGFFKYVVYQFDRSSIFEDYYIDPKSVEMKFPVEKKNLIYIMVESLESSFFKKENGGVMGESYIPNLENLALENISFSNNSNLGGFYTQTGNSWTAGALVSHTAGVPLKVLVHGNNYSGYSSFLPGVYSIGEILEANGYHNYFMMGSDANFAGRRQYFESHGNYQIMDYEWARKKQLIPSDYYTWWGYEDSKLYEFAKNELLEIAREEEPFNFTILTADTHFFDGYVDESCPQKFQSKYANSFYCADLLLNQFLKWLEKQEFYQDTVVVIVGDHLTMQNDFIKDITYEERTVYNAFVNVEGVIVQDKNRMVSTMDLFPTTLGALGVEISGDRLGLGTNLFSDRKTLLEELGSSKFNKELEKRSGFYNEYLLQDTYDEMKDRLWSDGYYGEEQK